MQHSRETEEQLEQKQHELDEIKTRFTELSKSLAATRAELEQTSNELEAIRELPAPVQAAPAQPEAAAAAQPAVPNDMMMSMLQELANLKATMAAQQAQPAPQQAPQTAAPDFSAALEKLTGSLNDRLENIGRKMGVSSAVESDKPLDFGGMFGDDQQVELESNMDNIKVKQKSAGGIAANLAKLKKLKGGG